MSAIRKSSYSPPRHLVFCFCFRGCSLGAGKFFTTALGVGLAANAFGEGTNSAAATMSLPDAGGSLLRVMGSLALVLGLFLGGVWFFKNWRRLTAPRGRQPKLNILETRSLGARQGVCVIAYEKQRFLVATSPAGISLLSHLPDAEAGESESVENQPGPMPFAQALAKVLKGK